MRKLINILFITAIAMQLGATDCGSVIRDSGFDLWCGEQLCAWKVERGEVKRVATWHEGDGGVELVGTDVAIAQLSPVDSSDGHCRDLPDGSRTCESPANVCIKFTLVANIDERASVDLNVDVSADGVVDHTQRLAFGKWQRLEYLLVVRKPFAGIRFQLAKTGGGVAQLGNIGAALADNCGDLPVIDARPAPLGSPCDTSTDCASGICGESAAKPPFYGTNDSATDTVCVACDDAHACGVGQVCGVGDALSPVRAVETTCVPVSAKQLGELCSRPSECATGFCTYGMCSTCFTDDDCLGAEKCGRAWELELATFRTAYVCSPSLGLRPAGDPCANHGDCRSGTCIGTERKQCFDGRPCETAAQCPFLSLQSSACNTVGIQGGICQ